VLEIELLRPGSRARSWCHRSVPIHFQRQAPRLMIVYVVLFRKGLALHGSEALLPIETRPLRLSPCDIVSFK